MANLKTKIKETASQDFLKIYSDFQLHYLFLKNIQRTRIIYSNAH